MKSLYFNRNITWSFKYLLIHNLCIHLLFVFSLNQSVHAEMRLRITDVLPEHSIANFSGLQYFSDKVVVCGKALCHKLLLFQKATWTHSAWSQTGDIHFLGTGRHEHTSSIYNLLLEWTVFKWGWKDKTAAGKGHVWKVLPISTFVTSIKFWTAKSRLKNLRKTFCSQPEIDTPTRKHLIAT